MAEKCENILSLMDLFQSQTPVTMKVYDYLEDLHMNFTFNLVLTLESLRPILETTAETKLTLAQKKQITAQLKEAFKKALEKVGKYMGEAQPGIGFLKQVRLFNPA